LWAIAQARLAPVAAGAPDGEIAAQERVARRFAVELETEVAVSASIRDSRQLTADVVRQQLLRDR
jgi:hypothetical protein